MVDYGYDIEKFKEYGGVVPKELFKKDAVDDNFDVPTEGFDTDIKRGDIFDIGPHRLLCGDATNEKDYQLLFGDRPADLVQTDPPYNVSYVGKTKDKLKIKNDRQSDVDFYKFLFDFFSAQILHTKAGGAWYVWHADSEGHNFRRAMVDAGVELKQCLIWVKNQLVMGRQDYHWQHEPCLYGWKSGAAHFWGNDRKQTTIMEFDKPSRSDKHPTMKPIPLIAYQIQNSSKEGDLVSDPFLGSGTTMVACEQISRVCWGMEIDPRYCQVILERMLAQNPNLKITKNGEEYGI
jgi:site-specific DNA-methyltransferase (adenine-specific)